MHQIQSDIKHVLLMPASLHKQTRTDMIVCRRIHKMMSIIRFLRSKKVVA